MQFILSYNNYAERLTLPVNPKEFRVTASQKNNTVPIINLGDLNIIGDAGLAEITPIESIFPAKYESYCLYRNIPNPLDAVALISKWKASKRPIRLIVTGMKVNIPVTIESFEYGIVSGSDDIEYTLQLKEYRFIEVTQVNDAAQSEEATRPADKTTPNTYTIKSGDSLFMIAKKLTGSSDNWRKIYDDNKSVIGNDHGAIKVGQKLVISV